MGPSQWLAMARDDLRAAELLAQHDLPVLSCFHAEQATEKALMALRLHHEQADGASTADGEPWPQPFAGGPCGDPIASEATQRAHRLVRRVAERIYPCA